jgi:hypothetical protein
VVDNPRLKARLADLVWLKQKPRVVEYALAAIDAYRMIPLRKETWLHDSKECWQRAIGIARMLKTAAGDRLKEMKEKVFAAFTAATNDDGFLSLWLADLLRENYLGEESALTIAIKLETIAKESLSEFYFNHEREYYSAASDWYRLAKDEAKTIEMTVLIAESWAKETVARSGPNHPSYMLASISAEKAIQIFRSIPRALRQSYNVDKKLEELGKLLAEAGVGAVEQMGVISTPGLDISAIVQNARGAVQGKDLMEAMKSFANINPGVNAEELRKGAIELIRDHPLQAIFPATTFSADGRVIAKKPSMNLGIEDSVENDAVIHAQMIQNYEIHVGITVQGSIVPALEVLLMEHRLREGDFVGLASQSPIIPLGRDRLFGKALFAGYDRDYASAIHLLSPQIEHMVRFHLKQRGVKTTSLDVNGIENEIGLSGLMEKPETVQVFGKDLCFEISALFCDSLGPNLRNQIAHGLLDYRDCQSTFTIYAWWYGLKLVFNTFWNTANARSVSDEEATNS